LQEGERLTALAFGCPVDFDNPILGTLKSTELGQIQNVFLEATPECDLKTPAVSILDEIDKIEGWESSPYLTRWHAVTQTPPHR
jgi:hypothetical protein